jgi:hypothetical protein
MFSEHDPSYEDSPFMDGPADDLMVATHESDSVSMETLEPPVELALPDSTELETAPSEYGLPEDWAEWDPPVQPDATSWTEEGYSTDWGEVDSTWAQDQGETVGPGHADDVYWGYQGDTNYCALYAVGSILADYSGEPVDMDEMVQRATENGWLAFDANGNALGVMSEHFDDLLNSYGVPSHSREPVEQGAWEDLNSALENGQRVVVALDSKEIDAGENVGTDFDADHAITVTGIDYAHGVVIANDSARAAGLEIPLEVFYDAWRDSSFAMTVTDEAMPEHGTEPGISGAAPDPRLAVLPFTLHASEPAPQLDDGNDL